MHPRTVDALVPGVIDVPLGMETPSALPRRGVLLVVGPGDTVGRGRGAGGHDDGTGDEDGGHGHPESWQGVMKSTHTVMIGVRRHLWRRVAARIPASHSSYSASLHSQTSISFSKFSVEVRT